ncbi:hypothetical protein GCM10023215_42660 [Pseudonocardia yuanmonensis]|uniref:DUF4190 domain-containing protein n=1 Tax=Pseudonocardia yuanmonensis TaxID=1095914 RepID=A0ABP8X5E7_9PSEU
MTTQNGPHSGHHDPRTPAPFDFQGQTPPQDPRDRHAGPQGGPPPQWTSQGTPHWSAQAPGWGSQGPGWAPPGGPVAPPQPGPGAVPQQFAPGPQYDAPRAPAPAHRNGLALAALICGIVGVLFGLVPLLFWIAGTLAVVAIPLALASLGRAKRGEASRGLTWAGLGAGLASLVMAIIGASIFFTAVNQLSEDLQQSSDELTAYNQCLQDAGTDLDKMNACRLPS